MGSDGRIVVSDTGNNYVQVFDKEGKFLFAFGNQDRGDATASPGIRPWSTAEAASGASVEAQK